MFPSALKDREICNRFKTERKAFQKIGKGYVDIFGFGEEKKKKKKKARLSSRNGYQKFLKKG